jgi:hypothetical protein
MESSDNAQVANLAAQILLEKRAFGIRPPRFREGWGANVLGGEESRIAAELAHKLRGVDPERAELIKAQFAPVLETARAAKGRARMQALVGAPIVGLGGLGALNYINQGRLETGRSPIL